ncbi:hypothetical protein NEIG_02565, partial [Nematocida sp. ERTm5]
YKYNIINKYNILNIYISISKEYYNNVYINILYNNSIIRICNIIGLDILCILYNISNIYISITESVLYYILCTEYKYMVKYIVYNMCSVRNFSDRIVNEIDEILDGKSDTVQLLHDNINISYSGNIIYNVLNIIISLYVNIIKIDSTNILLSDVMNKINDKIKSKKIKISAELLFIVITERKEEILKIINKNKQPENIKKSENKKTITSINTEFNKDIYSDIPFKLDNIIWYNPNDNNISGLFNITEPINLSNLHDIRSYKYNTDINRLNNKIIHNILHKDISNNDIIYDTVCNISNPVYNQTNSYYNISNNIPYTNRLINHNISNSNNDILDYLLALLPQDEIINELSLIISQDFILNRSKITELITIIENKLGMYRSTVINIIKKDFIIFNMHSIKSNNNNDTMCNNNTEYNTDSIISNNNDTMSNKLYNNNSIGYNIHSIISNDIIDKVCNNSIPRSIFKDVCVRTFIYSEYYWPCNNISTWNDHIHKVSKADSTEYNTHNIISNNNDTMCNKLYDNISSILNSICVEYTDKHTYVDITIEVDNTQCVISNINDTMCDKSCNTDSSEYTTQCLNISIPIIYLEYYYNKNIKIKKEEKNKIKEFWDYVYKII